MATSNNESGWIFSAKEDFCVFIIPVVFGFFFIFKIIPVYSGSFLFPIRFFFMTLMIDSAHVYSTVWRTYLDPSEVSRRKRLYISIPLLALFLLIACASISLRVLLIFSAYAAIIHFVRQQYGWMMVLSRKSGMKRCDRLLDQLAIYSLTLYPILWCHMKYDLYSGTGWYFKEDLLLGHLPNLEFILNPIVYVFIFLYGTRQIFLLFFMRSMMLGKIVFLVATGFSWFAGILMELGELISNDMITFMHGVPYMWLIYRDGRVRYKKKSPNFIFYTKMGAILFVFAAFVPAYVEEFFRNIFYKKWLLIVFPKISFLENINLSEMQISLLMSMLMLPALTHFILDGFLWTNKRYRF